MKRYSWEREDYSDFLMHYGVKGMKWKRIKKHIKNKFKDTGWGPSRGAASDITRGVSGMTGAFAKDSRVKKRSNMWDISPYLRGFQLPNSKEYELEPDILYEINNAKNKKKIRNLYSKSKY